MKMQCTGKYIHPVLFSAALFCSLQQIGITLPCFCKMLSEFKWLSNLLRQLNYCKSLSRAVDMCSFDSPSILLKNKLLFFMAYFVSVKETFCSHLRRIVQ